MADGAYPSDLLEFFLILSSRLAREYSPLAFVPFRELPGIQRPLYAAIARRDADLYEGLPLGITSYRPRRLPPRHGRGRLRPALDLPAPRRALLHRRRRIVDDHRRPHPAQARQRRGARRAHGRAVGWHDAPRRPRRLRHRLRQHERVGGEAHLAGDRR